MNQPSRAGLPVIRLTCHQLVRGLCAPEYTHLELKAMMNHSNPTTKPVLSTPEIALAIGVPLDSFRKRLHADGILKSLATRVGNAWIWPATVLPAVAARFV